MPTRGAQTKPLQLLSTCLFYLGVLVGLVLAAASAWADFEGLSYFATGAGYPPFGGMHCPVFISQTEEGMVTARFDNPNAGGIKPFYEVEISGPIAARHIEGQIEVPAHASREVAWATDARDVDLRPFIFLKMDVLPVAGFPTREDTCGILVADAAGIGGGQLLDLVLVLSLMLMAGGLVLPAVGLRPEQAAKYDIAASTEARRSTQALGVATVCAVLAGLAGWWLLGVVLCAISLLLLLIALRYVLME